MFLSLPSLVFSLPTLDLIKWVGKDPPTIKIKAYRSKTSTLALRSPCICVCLYSIIISNHNILAVTAELRADQEFDIVAIIASISLVQNHRRVGR